MTDSTRDMTNNHIEKLCPIRRLTRGPSQHFFGYYEKSPWDADDRLILCGRTDVFDRMPTPDDVLQLGVIDTAGDGQFQVVDETRAWCWQQGCMLQWLPPHYRDWIIFNDRDGDRFISRLRNLRTGETTSYDRPIYQLDPQGRYALSTNFARLATTRAGYGYEGVVDPWADEPCPAGDGIYRMDLQTGESRLLFSLAEAASIDPHESMTGATHWFNHIQINRDGSRFAALHRWSGPETRGHVTRLLIGDPAAGKMRLRHDNHYFSHYDWLGTDTIVGYALLPGTDDDRQFLILPADSDEVEVLGRGVFTADGHNSFSPDLAWMLNDMSYSRDDTQILMVYRMPDGPRIDVAKIHGEYKDYRPLRCDLHPRWNRAGNQACIDSTDDGTRQLLLIDLAEVVQNSGSNRRER